MSRRYSHAEWTAEALKAFRGVWVTVAEFAVVLGINDKGAASKELGRLVAHGVLIARLRSRDNHQKPGSLPMEYTLSPAWVGEVQR